MKHYELSHWEWESFFKDTDVLVVGSGIVGLSAAIRLKEQEPLLKVLVVERGPLPIGASTRNAGFACFGSVSELLDDLQHNSREEVLGLVAQRYRGLLRLRQRYGDEAIGYRAWGGYELFREEEGEVYETCRGALEELNGDLLPILSDEFQKSGALRKNAFLQTGLVSSPSPNHQPSAIFASADTHLPATGLRGIKHLILNRAEGQLHTGMLMKTLLNRAQALGILVLGGIAIEELSQDQTKVHLQTAHGWTLSANKVLLATNGFARQLLPELRVVPARNQVLVTEPIAKLKLQGCFHYNRGYVYFRNIGDRVLLGGGRHLDMEGEKTTELGSHERIRTYLTKLLHELILPEQEVKIERWWSGIMGVGTTKQPIIKRLGEHVVTAVRLGGMGVAIGTQVGEKAADKLLN